MKKFKIIAFAAFVTFSLSVAGTAFAYPGEHWGGNGGGYAPCYNGWNNAGTALSQEQVAKLDESRAKYWSNIEPLRQQLINKRAEYQSQMLSRNPDTGKIEVLSKEIGEIEGKLTSEDIRFRSELEAQGLPMAPYNNGNYGHRGGYGHGGGHGGCRGGGY